ARGSPCVGRPPRGASPPAVWMDADGAFVAVWTGSTFGAGSEGARVLGRRFDASGAPLGGEFQVNTLTTNNQWFPAVAALRAAGLWAHLGGFLAPARGREG